MCDCAYKRAVRVRRFESGCGRKVEKCVIAPTEEQTEGGSHKAAVGANLRSVRMCPLYQHAQQKRFSFT